MACYLTFPPVGPYSRRASVFAGQGIEECRQSLFKCYGVHVYSCLSHVSPTFSYRPKRDKSRTPVKSGSDNIVFFALYGTASIGCQGGVAEEWFREAGLSAPRKDAVSVIGGYRQVEVTRMPVYRKAEEPYGCGWVGRASLPTLGAFWVHYCLSESLWPKAPSVRNRQRRSWGGSAYTRY